MIRAETPRISVIIPCYHAIRDIRLAVESIAAQTYKNIEIVVISDDGEDYRPMLADLTSRIPIIFATTGTSRTGPSNTKNVGLALCTGDIISALDQDDYLDADFFEKQRGRVLAEGACMTLRRIVDYEHCQPIDIRNPHKMDDYKGMSRISIHDYLNFSFCWQTVYRRDMLRYAWEEEFSVDPDYVLECRLFNDIGYVPFEHYLGYNYRIRPGSICHSEDSHTVIFSDYQGMLKRLQNPSDRMGLTEEIGAEMSKVLTERIANIERYLQDRAAGRLQYEPNNICDLMRYCA